nr:unnamed protein product [Callosobruchus analis]
MAKHERKVHNIDRENHRPVIKKPPRPIPNLIPIPTTAIKHNPKADASEYPVLKTVEIPEPSEPAMSQKDINDICAKSTNSVLKDFASLFGSEDVFKTFASPKVPDLIPYPGMQSSKGKLAEVFKQKNASFFDSLREKLELGSNCNLTCGNCGHESKCLTEHAKHQKMCGKEADRRPSVVTVHNISSSRCQFCRQRCKSSTDLYNHLQICTEAMKSQNLIPKDEDDSEHELKIDEEQYEQEPESKPHPMENKVFVWNDIMVPMDIEVDDSIYEYTEDKVDDNVSLDLSTRTQSPMDSESSFVGGQEASQPSGVRHSPLPANEKIPTHGNDISVAQHKRVFKCPHCTFWASTASRFHVHIVGHLNKKPFECSLCAYRSNWRWDITKHIKLKSVRDPAHESAKVLMTDETGRRNYTKYNKYLTEIPISSEQSMDTSGGCGTRPKHHQQHDRSPSTSGGRMVDMTKLGPPTMVPVPADSTAYLTNITDKKRGGAADNKKTLFKCKKCNFKDASRDVLLQHVKGHYQHQPGTAAPMHPTSSSTAAEASSPSGSCSASGTTGTTVNDDCCSPQDLRIRGTSPDRDEASVNNIAGKGGCPTAGYAPFRCGHCNQVSNWKHVIQRHCRLKHSGDIRVVSNKNGHERLEVEEAVGEDTDVVQSKPFRCTLCPFSTDTGEELKAHLFGHVDGGRHQCFYCRYSVSHRDDLLAHLKLHGVADPDDFLAKVSDKNPLLDSAIDGKKFKCLTCPYVTNSKSQFTYHKQFHKPRGGQYTCTHCSYNVSKRHLLHQHLKVHGINVTSHKQNGEALYLDEVTDEIEEIPQSAAFNVDLQNFPDIPLVWVSKNGKFSKMFKCRYCPHVNLRKVNIQEHEKMHSAREKSCNSSRNGDSEHRCTECNYVCNNAGVLSSHSKVHQGLYGTVHRLVDPTRTDEEQIRELSRSLGIQPCSDAVVMDDIDLVDSSPNEDEIDSSSGSGSVLYFCKECPARFLKENEFGIHKRFHGSKLSYKCDYCSYTSREKPHLYSHYKVHTSEYQERTKILQSMYITSANYPQSTVVTKNFNGESAWVVSDTKSEMSTLCSILNKPLKSSQMVPLSGTDLFLQKSEAEQKHVAELSREASPLPDEGNGDSYASNLKNGKVKEKRYKCQKCPSAFDKKDQYKVHSNLHGAKQRYICDYCDYSVKYYANYIQHLKKHRMNAEALTSRRASDGIDVEPDETIEVTSDVDIKPKISVADRQIETILEQRQIYQPKELEEKKVYWCPNCPYTNPSKAAVSSHNKRHVSVSGIRNAYTCEHCDYSVPQNHFLREHTKLHFTTGKARQVEGFMNCDNVKLTSVKVEEGERDGEVFFEEHASKAESDRKVFSPPLNVDVEERFNNNEGERRYVNVQTGELVVKENSDKQSEGGDREYKMDII